MRPGQLLFKKLGHEVVEAIGKRIDDLASRLSKRDMELSELIKDEKKVRSYLIRSHEPNYRNPEDDSSLYSKVHISSEEKEEIAQLCRRVHEIEQEITRLRLIRSHLKPEQELELSLVELVKYGFEIEE